MRALLFLAVLGVVAAGMSLSTSNPTATVFETAAGQVGLRMFGVILWAAAITSVIGAAYTSVTFMTSEAHPRPAEDADHGRVHRAQRRGLPGGRHDAGDPARVRRRVQRADPADRVHDRSCGSPGGAATCSAGTAIRCGCSSSASSRGWSACSSATRRSSSSWGSCDRAAAALRPADARARFRDGLVTPTDRLVRRVGPGEPDHRPGRERLGRAAVRPAQPEVLPGARRAGGRARSPGRCSGRAATCAPTCPPTGCTGDGELVDQVPDVREHWRDDLVSVPARVQLHVRAGAAGGRGPGAAHRPGLQRADVPDDAAVPSGRRARRPARGVDAPDPVRAGADRGRDHRPVPGDARGARCRSATPARWGSPTSTRRTTATRSRSRAGEVPVFWACGVTPQAAVVESRLPLVIAHEPGHMLITDTPEPLVA